MNTQEATDLIARYAVYRDVPTDVFRAMARKAYPLAPGARDWGYEGYGMYESETDHARYDRAKNIRDREEGFCAAWGRINAQARAWNWDDVTKALWDIYSKLGAKAPEEGGYAFHRGVHPIQKAVVALEQAA